MDFGRVGEGGIGMPAWYERFGRICIAIAIVSVVLLLTQHYLHQHFKDSDWIIAVCDLLKEIGFACLVALFLNLSVEWVNRRRHIDHERSVVGALDKVYTERQDGLLLAIDQKYKETNSSLLQNVFTTVYMRHVDANVLEVIENHLLKKETLRTDYRAQLKISKLDSAITATLDRPMVKLSLTISYTLRNVTNNKISTVLLPAYIDITPGLEQHCNFSRMRIGSKVYMGAELQKYITTPPGAPALELRFPGEMAPREETQCSVTYEKVAPIDYSEVMVNTVPMDGMTVIVMCLDDSIEVDAISLHPEDAVANPENSSDRKEWTIDGILPGQGAMVIWHPKRTPAESAAR